jgi:uncharacterized membrane protein
MRLINRWGIFLSLIGMLDSGYLSWIKLSHSEEKCFAGIGNCAAVNSSVYSEVFNIPVAYLGLLTYLIILLLFLNVVKSGLIFKYRSYLLFGLSLIGFLFSCYLTYVQFALLKTFCPYCLLSALTTTVIFILSTTQLVKDINK